MRKMGITDTTERTVLIKAIDHAHDVETLLNVRVVFPDTRWWQISPDANQGDKPNQQNKVHPKKIRYHFVPSTGMVGRLSDYYYWLAKYLKFLAAPTGADMRRRRIRFFFEKKAHGSMFSKF
jgi:hypothetical protein